MYSRMPDKIFDIPKICSRFLGCNVYLEILMVILNVGGMVSINTVIPVAQNSPYSRIITVPPALSTQQG